MQPVSPVHAPTLSGVQLTLQQLVSGVPSVPLPTHALPYPTVDTDTVQDALPGALPEVGDVEEVSEEVAPRLRKLPQETFPTPLITSFCNLVGVTLDRTLVPSLETCALTEVYD